MFAAIDQLGAAVRAAGPLDARTSHLVQLVGAWGSSTVVWDAEGIVATVTLVITSYSIHYTKLYESMSGVAMPKASTPIW